MKLLLAYSGKAKKFDFESSLLAKIQIANSLDLGWKKEDILLATDFNYEHLGVKSTLIPDKLYYPFDNSSNKILVIIYLIKNGLIDEKTLFWYHDFDAYQLLPISESKLGLENCDLGITPYGYKPQWNLGSIFFKKSALDIFEKINYTILNERKSDNRCDEKAIKRLIVQKKINLNRIKELNVTYNLTKRCIQTNYNNAQKPLRVVHFHPWDKDAMMLETALNIFMYGENRLKIPLMTERLINIFNYHGIA